MKLLKTYQTPDFNLLVVWSKENCCAVIGQSKIHPTDGGGGTGGTDELEAAGSRSGIWDEPLESGDGPFDN